MPRSRTNAVSLLSLLLCLALLGLWVRSGWRSDTVWYAGERSTVSVNSETGRILFVWAKGPSPPLGFDGYFARHRSPLWHHVKHLFVFRAFESGNQTWAAQAPHWAAALAAAAPALWLRRHDPRRRPGHCTACGYDLRATPQQCPECGHRPSPVG